MTYSKKLSRSALLATSFLLLPACSGDGDKEPGAINSGLPADQKAEDLTADEAQQICDAAIEYADEVAQSVGDDVSCKIAGLIAAQLAHSLSEQSTEETLRSVCEDTYESCLEDSDAAEAGLDFSPAEENCDEEALAACDATVGEIEGCLTATLDAFGTLLKEIPSCNTLTIDDLDEFALDDASETPSECEQLDPSCSM
jgi:hypothetical protein